MTEKMNKAREIVNRQIEWKEEIIKENIKEIEKNSKKSTELMEQGDLVRAISYIEIVNRKAEDVSELKKEIMNLREQAKLLDYLER